MKDNTFAVVLVYSTSHAIRAEKVLKEAAFACRLIPVPRRLSSDCGVCVRILRAERERAVQLLNDARIDVQSIEDV